VYFLCQVSAAQIKTITGTVIDSATRGILQNVSISVKKGTSGALTDAEGKFRINVDKSAQKLLFTITGYHSLVLPLTDRIVQDVSISLSRDYTLLEDVVVNGKRGRYRNKNNPAVELIRQVIANKSKNGPAAYAFASFDQYEKMQVLMDKSFGSVMKNGLMKPYHFIFENADTIKVPGKSLSSVYLQETLSKNYYQKSPERKKKMVTGRKSVDFGPWLDMKGISIALNRLYQEINIYDNSIAVFTIQFISPVADLAPGFYMYYIEDSIVENGVKLVKLRFTPRNPEDLLFEGTLFITLDGNYAIQKAELGVNRKINLNYVREFKVNLDFEKGPATRYYLANSQMLAYFSPLPKGPIVYGERVVRISNLSDSSIGNSIFSGTPVDSLPQAAQQLDSFWAEQRPIPLSYTESRTYANTDSLLKLRSYRRLMDIATMLTAGYKSAGKLEIGPIGSFYSFNPVEGNKFLFGGRTTTRLSTRYYGESYLAYGLKDQRWKYYLSGTYSINNHSIYTYPFNYIQASFVRDTRNPGEENIFAEGNGFLYSFSRGDNSKWLYNDIFKLTYIHEFGNHYSYDFGMKYWNQQPAGSIQYLYEPSPDLFDSIRQIKTSEMSLTLRWAPHEQFYQGKSTRSDIINKYPIMTFQYAQGVNGLFGGEYNYDAFHLNIYKRCYLAPIGYSDITLDAGYLGGNLPFPLLIIHPANQSYFYQEGAYNLMNYEEFVSDHYVGINIDHFFNGFFFNKIPLFKKLRFREVIAAKILYGGVRDENNPDKNPAQMKFPVTNGFSSTYSLGGQPYLEASIGIYNILSIVRLDLVKRFTYLNHPDISGLGLRVSGNFNF
jgi:hypothetical protein